MNKVVNISGERENNGLSPLGGTLRPMAQKLLGKKGFVTADILTGWDRIVGKELAEYTFPQRIDFPRGEKNNGILHLCVPGGAFHREIKHREKYIIDKINTYFGYNAVSGLRIMQNLTFTPKKESPAAQKEKKLPPETEKHIENLAASIDNPKLKNIIIKLGRDIYKQHLNETEK